MKGERILLNMIIHETLFFRGKNLTSAFNELGTTFSYSTTTHCNAHKRERIKALSRSSTPSLALNHPVLEITLGYITERMSNISAEQQGHEYPA